MPTKRWKTGRIVRLRPRSKRPGSTRAKTSRNESTRRVGRKESGRLALSSDRATPLPPRAAYRVRTSAEALARLRPPIAGALAVSSSGRRAPAPRRVGSNAARATGSTFTSSRSAALGTASGRRISTSGLFGICRSVFDDEPDLYLVSLLTRRDTRRANRATTKTSK